MSPYGYDLPGYKERTVAGQLPLRRPDFDIYIGERDIVQGAQFPPERFRARDTHLDHLDCIYRGDFSLFVENQSEVMIPISPARRLVTVQVDLLMMSTPEAAYPLRTVAADALRDMLVYGGAVIIVDQGGAVDSLDARIADVQDMGPNIYTASPLTWYPLEMGGAVLVRPYISVMQETSDLADMAEITILGESGEMIEVRDHHWDGVGLYGTLGAQVGERSGGNGGVLISARSPQEDIWGESLLLDLAPPLVELAKRFSQNSSILDKNADPVPVWNASTDDAELMFPLTDDDDEDTTVEDKIVQGFAKMRQGDAIHLNDRTQKVSYLEFSGQLPASFMQINSVREMIAQMSGLPAILDSLDAGSPSGVSLRLQYLPFYAATSAMQQDLMEVLSNALKLGGMAPEIEWPHIFDTLDAERNATIAERTASWGADL